MSDANTFFANDEWEQVDWLRALDRLAVTPPLEEIPASSKILESATKPPMWGWPMPRTFANQIPDDEQTILVWRNQEWLPAYMSHHLKCYFLLGDPDEEQYGLSVDGIWLPLPPALEVQA